MVPPNAPDMINVHRPHAVTLSHHSIALPLTWAETPAHGAFSLLHHTSLCTPFLLASLPGLPRPVPISCHFSSSTLPTGHLPSGLIPSHPSPQGERMQPGEPEKLPFKEGPEPREVSPLALLLP